MNGWKYFVGIGEKRKPKTKLLFKFDQIIGDLVELQFRRRLIKVKER